MVVKSQCIMLWELHIHLKEIKAMCIIKVQFEAIHIINSSSAKAVAITVQTTDLAPIKIWFLDFRITLNEIFK